MAPKPVYLSPAELCERWHNAVTVKTLANWRCLGKGPMYRRIGRRILYPLAEVESFEAHQHFLSTDEYGKKSGGRSRHERTA